MPPQKDRGDAIVIPIAVTEISTMFFFILAFRESVLPPKTCVMLYHRTSFDPRGNDIIYVMAKLNKNKSFTYGFITIDAFQAKLPILQEHRPSCCTTKRGKIICIPHTEQNIYHAGMFLGYETRSSAWSHLSKNNVSLPGSCASHCVLSLKSYT